MQHIYRFYVYAYIRSKDSETAKAGTPYYIGKGTGNRAWNTHKGNHITVPKDKNFIIILEENLSDIGALAIERRLILWYGRKDLNTGILVNLTDGGEGCSGYICSIETKQKLKESRKQQIMQPRSDETKQKLSVANKGKKQSAETKQKRSDSLRQTFIVIDIDGNETIVTNAQQYCLDNGYTYCCFTSAAKHNKKYKGLIITKA